jgi:hypothetical protein
VEASGEDAMAWNFFRPRAFNSDDIDLNTLIEAAADNPVKRYVNLLIMDMVAREIAERTFSEAELPPGFEDFDDTLPQFAVVVNRLKVMSGLDPVMYKMPREGRIELVVQGVPLDAFTRFDDIERTVSIRIQPAAESPTL